MPRDSCLYWRIVISFQDAEDVIENVLFKDVKLEGALYARGQIAKSTIFSPIRYNCPKNDDFWSKREKRA